MTTEFTLTDNYDYKTKETRPKRDTIPARDEVFLTYKTEATSPENKMLNISSVRSSPERLVSEIEGSIAGLDDKTVEVKLSTGLAVKFPKVLFKDKALLTFGQPIKYQIKIGPDGFRYQAFIKREVHLNSDKKKRILGLLDDMKFSK